MVAIRRSKKSRSSKRNTLLTKLCLGGIGCLVIIITFLGLLLTSSSSKDDNNDHHHMKTYNEIKNEFQSNVGSIRKSIMNHKNERNDIHINNNNNNDNNNINDNIHTPEVVTKQNQDIKSSNIQPSKPLRPTNKAIIATAPMVDISYVDVTNNHKEHPHLGAMDENDNFGYKHDEKSLRNNPPSFQIVNKNDVKCDHHDNNYKMLTEKVHVDITSHEAREREAENGGKPRAKLFCMVYTISKYHDKIPNIRETWGQKCDGFIVASDKTDKELGTVNIPHEGEEEYHNIWQKVRSMWSYVYDNYYEDYDWFHIGGDDLYLIVENMRLYLESEEVLLAANGGEYLPRGDEKEQLPLFLGRRFAEQGNYERIFNSGGSGYTLNKAALKSLVVTAFPTCMPHLKTFAEDVMVAQCLRNKIKVFPFDTKDDNGGERYMPFQVSTKSVIIVIQCSSFSNILVFFSFHVSFSISKKL